MQIRGHGKLHISLLEYFGKDPRITEMDNDVYVTSSPFNIIPPQNIIANLKTKDNLYVDYEKHDDTEYIISFKRSICDYPTARSPYQLGVMLPFTYGPRQAICTYEK